MSTTTLDVTGMTCGHCVKAVQSELTALAGVTAVDVALVAGGTTPVTVTTDAVVSEAALRAAVDEAGYEVVGIRIPADTSAGTSSGTSAGTSSGTAASPSVDLSVDPSVNLGATPHGSATPGPRLLSLTAKDAPGGACGCGCGH